MTTPLDLISRALKDIGALEAGEPASADAVQDGLDMLNDMIDQWSNEDMMVFNISEIVFPVIAGQVQYTIGPNHASANFIGAQFTGSVAGNVLTVTNLLSGAVVQGQYLTGTGIPEGTKILQNLTGAGGQVNYTGTYLLNRNLGTVASGTIQAYYQKPLGIDSAYVRINTNSNGQPITNGGLDYQIAVLNVDDYNAIGLKTLNGPWPKALYFNPNEDSGNLFLWPNPAQGEVHLFAQTIFRNYSSIDDDVNLPQGYSMALRWCLAERLMPMYGKNNQVQIAMIQGFAAQAKSTLKRTNMKPMQTARFPDAMLQSKQKDAGWILTGGFFN